MLNYYRNEQHKNDFTTLTLSTSKTTRHDLYQRIITYFPKASCPIKFRKSLFNLLSRISVSDVIIIIREPGFYRIPPLKILFVNGKTFKMGKEEFNLSEKQEEIKCLFRRVIVNCYKKQWLVDLRISSWLYDSLDRSNGKTKVPWQHLLSMSSLQASFV